MMSTRSFLKVHYSLFCCFVFTALAFGQDTLYVNLFKTQPIVFEDDIVTVSKGTDGVQLNHIVENKNVLILKSKVEKKNFIPTTLYIKTAQGYHYNFLVKYSENPSIQLKSISLSAAALKPTAVNSYPTKLKTSQPTQNTLTKVLADKRKLKRHYARFDQVYLRFVNHYYVDGAVYYKFEIDNQSSFDYLIEYFKFFIQTKGNGKKESNTKKLFEEGTDYSLIHGHHNLKPEESRFFVLKFNKFSLNKEQNLIVELKEKSGGRDLFLKINSRLVNQPLTL